nr:MAG TPA: hypothetical protein [Caudoviricetes sp.]
MKIAGSFFLFILSEFRKKIVALQFPAVPLYWEGNGMKRWRNRP